MLTCTLLHDSVARGAGGPQLEYYQQCMAKHGSAHKYMAFIDSDEVRPSPAITCIGPAALLLLCHLGSCLPSVDHGHSSARQQTLHPLTRAAALR